MIRVLQVVNIMDRAGLENMLMNYYRNIDRTQIQFDFLTHRPQRGAYDDEIEAYGGRIYRAPRLLPQNYLKYFKWMKQFFSAHPEYNIVHSHIDAMSFFPLWAAKMNDVPIRIAHSHSSKLDKDLKLPIKFVALKNIPRVANLNCACGKKAGEFMFPKQQFQVIHNAIDTERYERNELVRNKKRSELGIDNEFVVGHVGRYCYIKNQMFLIDIFVEVLKKNPRSLLMLVGSGEDEEKIKTKAKSLGVLKKILFLKDRDDVNELYQVMDCFVLPSLFEGLPLVGVEAQVAGLRCVVSDRVSNEVKLTDNLELLPLDAGASIWADRICTHTDTHKVNNELFASLGYDIKTEAIKLERLYKKIGAERDKL